MSLLNDMEAMFAEKEAQGKILSERIYDHKGSILEKYGYSPEKDLRDKSVTIGSHPFKLHYICTRRMRDAKKPRIKDGKEEYDDLLVDLGIRNPAATQYYEDDTHDDPALLTYKKKDDLPPKIISTLKKATIFNYGEQNEGGRLIPLYLLSKDGVPQAFDITPNWAPFDKNHFIVFADNDGDTSLKQMFHPKGTLYWIDDLFSKIGNPDYRLFFNGVDAGNSMTTLHFQILQSSFPAFESLDRKYPDKDAELIWTTREDWPCEGIFARYTAGTRNAVLSALENKIKLKLSDRNATFNLLFQTKPSGHREFFFVPRETGKRFIKGLKNGFAGYEISGNIIVENRDEYDNFAPEIPELVFVSSNGS